MTSTHAEEAFLTDSQPKQLNRLDQPCRLEQVGRVDQHARFDQFDLFLQEATAIEPPADAAIGRNRLYGLYTSWCFLSHTPPRTEGVFWAAMKQKGIRPGHAKLRMTGPAATDYILSTYPGMV